MLNKEEKKHFRTNQQMFLFLICVCVFNHSWRYKPCCPPPNCIFSLYLALPSLSLGRLNIKSRKVTCVWLDSRRDAGKRKKNCKEGEIFL